MSITTFLTSSPTGDYDGQYKSEGIDNRNHFLDELKKVYVGGKVLMITAFPNEIERNDEMISFFRNAFDISSLKYTSFDLWDCRTDYSEVIKEYSLIILGGGHVPTQNQFFKEIHLKELLKDYNGIVIGISAGTMNCAEVVYVQPEEEGESSPSFNRFIEGLGLSEIQVLPHYQVTKHFYLDGKRLYEDITYIDSFNHRFICINDGSYIIVKEGHHYLYGEGYKIEDGHLSLINENNQVLEL